MFFILSCLFVLTKNLRKQKNERFLKFAGNTNFTKKILSS